MIRIPNYTNNKADDNTLPAPSLAQLTKDNHLILEQALRARVVNNFEHYSLKESRLKSQPSLVVGLKAYP
ncbi:hypothetical protein FMR28_05760 [Campylobacter coli]|nr:hypothetical protein [Campylobacter coli]